MLFSAVVGQADNTAISYAYPVSDISIDGIVSDWPSHIKKYPINEFPYGNELKGNSDFKAYFQVGYNLERQSLYTAIVVEDDAYFVDSTGQLGWDQQDVCMLYFDRLHAPEGSGVNLYVFNEYFKEVTNATTSWDPTVHGANWDDIKVATKRSGNRIVYEWSIQLGEYIKPGRSMGLDIVMIDQDPEEAYDFISWGGEGGKSRSPGRLGDVLLLEEGQPIGTVYGQIKFNDATISGFPGRIRLTNVDHPDMWVQTEVDTLGNYTVELPEGRYRTSLVWKFFYKNDKVNRSNDQTDFVFVDCKADQKMQAPRLNISHLPTPDLVPEKGVLHDFNTKAAVHLDAFIEAYRSYYEIPGVSLALIKDGEIAYHKTYGVKNALTGAPVDERTLFEAASVTKPVFGYVVCRLAERGIIDLDKPLYQYLPFEDIAHDERYQLITARHVLTHQTGFPNWAYMNEDGKLDIKFEPGTDYGYSGEGFEYLKRVVAHITQKDIAETLREEVLEPMGMSHTFFQHNEYLEEVVANGHFSNMPTAALLPSRPGMAWSMHTEAKEFTRFMQGLMDQKGLKAETYQDMFGLHTTIPREGADKKEGREEYFGLGIWQEKTPYGMVFGHGGNNGDFKCQFKMYKDLKMGFVVFTNADTGGHLNDALTYFLVEGKEEEHK